jgi:hypothetical protein
VFLPRASEAKKPSNKTAVAIFKVLSGLFGNFIWQKHPYSEKNSATKLVPIFSKRVSPFYGNLFSEKGMQIKPGREGQISPFWFCSLLSIPEPGREINPQKAAFNRFSRPPFSPLKTCYNEPQMT